MRVLILLVSTLWLVACGGGGSSSSTSTTAATAATLYPSTVEYTSVDPTAPANYAAPTLPVHYDATLLATSNQTAANVLTDRGATLGRVLFNDKRLSFNDSKSCASCHSQANGFADTAQFSAGFAGGVTTAHAMRLGNIAFYQAPAGGTATMFWDKRAASVEAQATQPIQNAVEMGFDSATHGGFAALITKMQALPYYPELFKWVFGDSTITEARVQNALAQFERSIISSSSKWDRAYAVVYATIPVGNSNQKFALPLNGTNIPAVDRFTVSEESGRALFIQAPANGGKGCAGCHQPPTFSLNANSRSNGLDAGETKIFKSPSLKNVGLAGRFMHDGRFGTLAEVLTHYATGIKASGTAADNRPALDNRLPR
jgi:cytochrome c peroxidase